jgi:hypothetical protein
MTSQHQADIALSIYQAHRKSPEIEALLDQFFNFPSQDEYERDLDVIRKCLERK